MEERGISSSSHHRDLAETREPQNPFSGGVFSPRLKGLKQGFPSAGWDTLAVCTAPFSRDPTAAAPLLSVLGRSGSTSPFWKPALPSPCLPAPALQPPSLAHHIHHLNGSGACPCHMFCEWHVFLVDSHGPPLQPQPRVGSFTFQALSRSVWCRVRPGAAGPGPGSRPLTQRK